MRFFILKNKTITFINIKNKYFIHLGAFLFVLMEPMIPYSTCHLYNGNNDCHEDCNDDNMWLMYIIISNLVHF